MITDTGARFVPSVLMAIDTVTSSLVTIILLSCFAASARASPRTWQPLVVTGAQLPRELGARENRIEIIAFKDGRITPIPFQIDKRRADGRYVMPNGPNPVADDHPGKLHNDDELVMMLADMGTRVPATQYLASGTLEIKTVDPLDGQARYAYIAAVDAPLRSSVHYLYYDRAADRIETTFYRIGLTDGWPTEFALQHQIHGDAPNLIDRFKVRTSATILQLFSYRMNENDIHNRLLAWKVGPVRMLRLESHSVNLLLGIHSPHVQSQVFMYRNYMENPTRINFPWMPRLVLDNLKLRLDVDYFNLNGFQLTWSAMRTPPLVIGSNSPEERKLEHGPTGPPIRWLALRGDDRLLMQALRPSRDFDLLQLSLYYRNSSVPDPPEKYPGEHPGIGYVIGGYQNLGRGIHIFDSLFVIAPATYQATTLIHELGSSPSVTVTPFVKGK